MKSICIATGTRAEYGILKPLIARIMENSNFSLRLLVTGSHLCPEFDLTYTDIETDGIPIDEKIEVLLSSNTNTGIAKSTGLAMISFAEYFTRKKPYLLIVLGDRFEIFSCASAAALLQVPIAHLHGGESTEGIIDEFIRHSITKMSALHFTSCETYRKRVIQLGEQPSCVYNVGALGVENVMRVPLMALDELSNDLGFPLENGQYCVVTFHPVTLEHETAAWQLGELMSAMDKFPQMQFIITGSNADAGGRQINSRWGEYVADRGNCMFATSLGMTRYLSALKYSAAIIGNSSSGILEGPASKIPTVDIGDRQKGRLCADSIIHCEPIIDEIVEAMEKAFSPGFRDFCRKVKNPYGDGNTSERIVSILMDRLRTGIPLKKEFYNIEFEV